jgi:heparan-sulfate lyase
MLSILLYARAAGVQAPPELSQRVRRMVEYLTAIVTPDGMLPMFSDSLRPPQGASDRSGGLRPELLEMAARVFNEPAFLAWRGRDPARLPARTSYAFPEAGMYVMRSGWAAGDTWFMLHCAPPITMPGHDHADNGTFELYALGKWLMTDTGYFTFGHRPDIRKWIVQTRVHQTMTLDNQDARQEGRHRLWHAGAGVDVLVAENAAYPDLVHRRTVWFVDHRFFVLLDEAISLPGKVAGEVRIHFQLAPGAAKTDWAGKQVRTAFGDANVLVAPASPQTVELEEEEGWCSFEYGRREPRMAFCYRHHDPAPARFLTWLVPYRGRTAPSVQAEMIEGQTGSDRVEIEAGVEGKAWRLGRDLGAGSAWGELC